LLADIPLGKVHVFSCTKIEDKMLQDEIINKARNGVCAIGYLSVPLTAYLGDVTKPYFKVIGTGFLVRQTTAITNRHVIQGLLAEQADLGFPDSQLFISFVALDEQQNLQLTLRMARGFVAHEELNIDVGFIEFKLEPAEQFRNIEPLLIVDKWDLRITEEVVVCGYLLAIQCWSKMERRIGGVR
jgi:hypothetical protein